MKQPKVSLLIFLLAGTLLLTPAQAQYKLLKSVFGNGGTTLAGGNYQSQGTLGQPLAGKMSSAAYSSQVGFWYAPGVSSVITWQANIFISDAGALSATLTFGQAPTAMDRLDPTLDEKELPPIPPSGVFDARLVLPGLPIIGSLKDFRPDPADAVTWTLKFQPGPAGFPMTLSWNSATLPTGNFQLKDAITGAIINVNMKTQSNLTVTNSAINSLLIEKTTELTRTVNVTADWNIISVPLRAADMRATALFPGAASEAFRFDNGYVAETILANGIGYWLKFTGPRAYEIRGLEVTPKTVAVKAGWNIIGLFESNVPVAAITSQPAGIVVSDYFEFSNGYKSFSTLQVGKGYWVKTNQAGTLLLSSGGSVSKGVVTLAANHSAWPTLHIEDSQGEIRTLYFRPGNENVNNFELPPVPPAGIFDVRFSTGRVAENLSAASWEIQIHSALYPLKIKAENLSPTVLAVSDVLNGALLNETLTEGREVVIAKAVERLLIKAGSPSLLPVQYELSQNHPNPFNPTAVIKYALPEAGHVKISVYSLLGEKMADLVDTVLPAGYHQVEVDAKNYSSGIYFYVMQSGRFKSVRKMVMMR